MIHHWKGLDLEITDFFNTMVRHPQGKLYHFTSQTVKHVEVIKHSDKPT